MLKSARGDCTSSSRARGCKPCPNTVELCLNSLQVTAGPYPSKKWGLGGYADAKSPAGDCASGLGLVHANHVLIQYNFARVTNIATVLKSLLDSSIPRQFLDMLDSF